MTEKREVAIVSPDETDEPLYFEVTDRLEERELKRQFPQAQGLKYHFNNKCRAVSLENGAYILHPEVHKYILCIASGASTKNANMSRVSSLITAFKAQNTSDKQQPKTSVLNKFKSKILCVGLLQRENKSDPFKQVTKVTGGGIRELTLLTNKKYRVEDIISRGRETFSDNKICKVILENSIIELGTYYGVVIPEFNNAKEEFIGLWDYLSNNYTTSRIRLYLLVTAQSSSILSHTEEDNSSDSYELPVTSWQTLSSSSSSSLSKRNDSVELPPLKRHCSRPVSTDVDELSIHRHVKSVLPVPDAHSRSLLNSISTAGESHANTNFYSNLSNDGVNHLTPDQENKSMNIPDKEKTVSIITSLPKPKLPKSPGVTVSILSRVQVVYLQLKHSEYSDVPSYQWKDKKQLFDEYFGEAADSEDFLQFNPLFYNNFLDSIFYSYHYS